MYCDHCFTEFCTKTTRDQLFSHCYLPCEEPVVVGVSGGPHSLFLLHQLGILRKQGELRQGAGAVNFELLPFHLREDELVLPPLQASSSPAESSKDDAQKVNPFASETTEHVQQLRDTLLRQFDQLEALVRGMEGEWEYANCPLFSPDEIQIYSYSDFLRPQELQMLRGCLHHPRLPLTPREELYERVRQRVLNLATRKRTAQWRAAKAEKERENKERNLLFSSSLAESSPEANGVIESSKPSPSWHHLAVGDGVPRCCIAALKVIVQGGTGEQIAHQSSSRGYMADIVVLRPLRALLTKEIIFYNRLHGIACGYTPALCTATSLPSLHRVLEQFVHSLVSNYWTSAFNVLNTVKKIEVGPPAVEVVLKGLVQPSHDESEEKEPAIMPGKPPNPPKKTKKKNNTLGRSAQLYHAQLQRTEPLLHHMRRRVGEEDPVRCRSPEHAPNPSAPGVEKNKNEDPNAIGTSCFVCGCPFSAIHGAIWTERVLTPALSEEPCEGEEMAEEYYLCHSCHGCLEDVVGFKPASSPQTQQPHTAGIVEGSNAKFNSEGLLSVLAALASSF
ncbi:unnamed protein product [Phytomonas sp. Hart1]|nr:unnamed protein product [Phytomonas sp. Hart1]|eukprot:CCW66813.1 unnamed protein product [Phytomonas sp. isolate Hart1]